MIKSQFSHDYSNRNRRGDHRHQNNNLKQFRTYHDEHSDDDFSSQSSDHSNDRLTIDYLKMEEADEKRIQKINDDNNIKIHFSNKINTIKSVIIKVFCNRCNKKFDSNNKLHQHIKSKTCRKSHCSSISTTIFSTFSDTALNTITNSTFSTIDESIAPSFAKSFADIETNFKNLNFIDINIYHVLFVKSFFKEFQFIVSFVFLFFQFKKYGFCGWKYASCNVVFVKQNKLQNVYIDSNCMMFLIDCKFLKTNVFNVEIQKINSFMTIKKVDIVTHQTNEYVNIDFSLFTSINEIVYLKYEFYFINDFKINMLISIDIMTVENMIFNFFE